MADDQQAPLSFPVWNVGTTIAFSVIIMLGFLTVQSVAGIAVICFEIAEQLGGPVENWSVQGDLLVMNGQTFNMEAMLTSGTSISCISISSGILCSLIVVWIIRLKDGANVKDYLNLYPIARKDLLLYLGLAIFYMAFSEVMARNFPEFNTSFMVDTYNSANSVPLLLLGVGVLGPIFEEFFFRGFLFKGLERSRLGGIGTVIVTTLVFTGIHLQYDWMVLLVLLPMGLILGMARYKSQSLYLPILIHMINNVASTAMVGFDL